MTSEIIFRGEQATASGLDFNASVVDAAHGLRRTRRGASCRRRTAGTGGSIQTAEPPIFREK